MIPSFLAGILRSRAGQTGRSRSIESLSSTLYARIDTARMRKAVISEIAFCPRLGDGLVQHGMAREGRGGNARTESPRWNSASPSISTVQSLTPDILFASSRRGARPRWTSPPPPVCPSLLPGRAESTNLHSKASPQPGTGWIVVRGWMAAGVQWTNRYIVPPRGEAPDLAGGVHTSPDFGKKVNSHHQPPLQTGRFQHFI
ncbi:hypothetical protein N7512_008937 [Penicillium capsulatum]|nr:hypothetical protein N7512_008937 [Penicillium capsulatum]